MTMTRWNLLALLVLGSTAAGAAGGGAAPPSEQGAQAAQGGQAAQAAQGGQAAQKAQPAFAKRFDFAPGQMVPIDAPAGAIKLQWVRVVAETVEAAQTGKKPAKPTTVLKLTLAVANDSPNDQRITVAAFFEDKSGHVIATAKGSDTCEEEDE